MSRPADAPRTRESSDSYTGEIHRQDAWRVVICREGIQWLLQHQREGTAAATGRWDTQGYCQSRGALIRLWRAATGQDGASLLDLLPEHVGGS